MIIILLVNNFVFRNEETHMEDLLAPHRPALVLIAYMVLIVLLQGFVSAFFRNAVEKFQPGETLPANHASATFRQVRAFENSLENAPLFILTAALAIAIGVSAGWVWWTASIVLVSRALHWLFYTINAPTLRTAAFAAGSFATLALAVATVMRAY